MSTPVPFKTYLQPFGDSTEVLVGAYPNTPYGQSEGNLQSVYDALKSLASNQSRGDANMRTVAGQYLSSVGDISSGSLNAAQSDALFNAYKTLYGSQASTDFNKIFAPGAVNTSPYVINAAGTYTTAAAEGETAAHEAAVAAGTEKRIQVGSGVGYVPTGSAAAKATPTGNVPLPQATPPIAAPGANPLPGQTANPANQMQPNAAQPNAATQGAVLPTVPSTVLQPGNRGDAVKQLQDYLVAKGLMTEAQKMTGYGVYGTQTQAAVAALQKQLGVDNSSGVGYFGPKTIAAVQKAGSAAGETPQIGNTPTDPNASAGTGTDTPASDPIQDVIDTYTKVYQKLGLGDIKSQYQDILKKQADLTNEMNGKIEEVHNDPWLSQGVKDARVKRIQDSYETKLNTQTHLAQLYDSLYKEGQDQAKFLIGEINDNRAAALIAAQKKQDAIDALAKDNEIRSIGGRELLINKATGKTVADLGPSPKGTGSNNVISDNERALLSQYNGLPEVKDYKTILSQKLTVDSILGGKLGGPGDLAVVYNFMKALDPNSVVRETEYATAAKSGNIFQGVYSQFNGYLKPEGGFLPDNVKTNFQSIINKSLSARRALVDTASKEYRDIAQRQGLNPDNVVPNYTSTQDNISNTPPPSTSQFEDIKSSITLDAATHKAYIPRSIWSTLGERQDALLLEAKNDGYQLLVN